MHRPNVTTLLLTLLICGTADAFEIETSVGFCDGSLLFADGFESVDTTYWSPQSGGEPIELAGFTQEHNRVRETVCLPALTWDAALAATAQVWVDQCIDLQPQDGYIDHNPSRSAGHPWYVGENIAALFGLPPIAAVESWADESSDYDYETNTCAPFKSCNEYKQLVWAATKKVGCGLSVCFGKDTYIICNYGPGQDHDGQPY